MELYNRMSKYDDLYWDVNKLQATHPTFLHNKNADLAKVSKAMRPDWKTAQRMIKTLHGEYGLMQTHADPVEV